MKMKTIFFTLFLIWCTQMSMATSTPIPQSNYVVTYVSSQNATNVVGRAFDGNASTWWALSSTGFTLPGIVEVDLGANYDVSGFSYAPMATTAGANSKAIGFEIYLSSDGITWGTPEKAGDFPWLSAADNSIQDIFFGAITARYVKMVYTTSSHVSGNILTSELFFYESDVAATGQINQIINFNSIPKKDVSDPSFAVSATASSGLPMTYSIVSGPATVSGNMVTLTGTPGTVIIKATQAGDSTYYMAEINRVFQVIDISTYYPVATTRLTEDFPLEMPNLVAYHIYMNATIVEPGFLSIDRMEVEIGGTTYQATKYGSYYYYLWTPAATGDYIINIKAVGSNGNENVITKNITVTNTVVSQNVETIKNVDIIYGGTNSRWYYGKYNMPQHAGSYDKIFANLTVGCPAIANACDDWDRLAYIDILGPDGNWIQIIRYITPYGVACNHEIELTDYASLLQGEVEFRIFIDTWGTGGWQISLDFDFQQGTPEYLYSQVDEIWDGAWDLGNLSNLQPVDTVNYTYNSNCLKSHLRLSTTGHAWGSLNSQNAAEFYHATNYIDLNGSQYYVQDLWNTCNPNPDNCTGQQGTWSYNRAGWCPGSIAPPNIIDMTSNITTPMIDLTYRFDPTYVDYCNPNNPDCVTGVTCTDCNDTYNPTYQVDAHLINFSNTPLLPVTTGIKKNDNTLKYDINVYPNPTSGMFSIATTGLTADARLLIQTVSGKLIKAYYFKSPEQLNAYSFDLSNVESGVYYISLENAAGQGTSKIVIQK